MNYRLFFLQLERTYDTLIMSFPQWVIAEWQPNIHGGKWYELERHHLPEYAYGKLAEIQANYLAGVYGDPDE